MPNDVKPLSTTSTAMEEGSESGVALHDEEMDGNSLTESCFRGVYMVIDWILGTIMIICVGSN